jgi:hypothetical protein
MAARVRTHTRRSASGGMTTVRQHSRRTRGGRGLMSPRHAWSLARRALRAMRRRKRGTALALGGLAVGELGAWLALRGVFVVMATAAILALGVAFLAAQASGAET